MLIHLIGGPLDGCIKTIHEGNKYSEQRLKDNWYKPDTQITGQIDTFNYEMLMFEYKGEMKPLLSHSGCIYFVFISHT